MSFNTYPYSPFPASTEQLHKGDNEDLQAQIDAIKDGTEIDSFGDVETALGVVTGDITDLKTDKADAAVIAPAFDAEAGVYAVGDLVMYQGKLYEFTTAHETAGDWDPTEVTEKTVADEVNSVKSGLTNLIGDMPVKVFKDNIPNNGAISIQLEANKLYQYYTWRDSEGYVYMGIIDVAYTGIITNHPIIKPQVDSLSITDGGNMVLSVANSTNYQAAILLYDVSK